MVTSVDHPVYLITESVFYRESFLKGRREIQLYSCFKLVHTSPFLKLLVTNILILLFPNKGQTITIA